MKNAVSLFLALMLVCMAAVCAAESIDLSGLSFDELVALKDRINIAIWESKEWQQVKVPIGMWEVGKDIPAGKWTVKCAVNGFSRIKFGNVLEDGGTDISYRSTKYGYESVYNEKYKYYEAGKDPVEFTFEVEDGDYILIEKGDVYFTPYAGKPDLGFK